MAKLSGLKLSHRIFLAGYRYRSFDWAPAAQLRKPLSRVRMALLTTAGFHFQDQLPFDENAKGGDFSYRIIPQDALLETLSISHKSDAFDQCGIQQDKNLALPLARLEELVERGGLDSITQRHFSLMGSITAPGRLVAKTAPRIAGLLRENGADALLLTPV